MKKPKRPESNHQFQKERAALLRSYRGKSSKKRLLCGESPRYLGPLRKPTATTAQTSEVRKKYYHLGAAVIGEEDKRLQQIASETRTFVQNHSTTVGLFEMHWIRFAPVFHQSPCSFSQRFDFIKRSRMRI